MQPGLSLEQIEALRAALDRSEKEAQSFLQHVMHDLRTVRRSVGISAEVLLAGLSGEPGHERQHQAGRHIEDGLGKMDAILAGISSYSLSLRSSDYSFGPISAAMAIRQALASLEKPIREVGAVIVHSGLPQLAGDRERLTTLFRNLIDNSLKYRGQAVPQIEIQAQQREDNWLFSVKDNGVGIEPRYWESVFAPFARLHGADIPGVGLGLAICRKIVEAHQGNIWIESNPGEGTTVFVSFPARRLP